MKAAAAMLVMALLLAQGSAQETTTEPSPVTPTAPGSKQQSGPQPATQQPPAPVERRASKPGATSVEPVAGPLTKTGGTAQSDPQPAGQSKKSGGDVATFRVRTRLVNVALNVVDAHGAPVGGFEKKDFQVSEDGKPQTIAVFERDASSPLHSAPTGRARPDGFLRHGA
jgi:hypothetical protein